MTRMSFEKTKANTKVDLGGSRALSKDQWAKGQDQSRRPREEVASLGAAGKEVLCHCFSACVLTTLPAMPHQVEPLLDVLQSFKVH